MKRVLSLLLVAAMMVTMFASISVFAAPEEVPGATIIIEQDDVEENVYNIVLVPEAGTAIERFASVQFRYENNQATGNVNEVIEAADGITLSSEDGLYLAHPEADESGEIATITKGVDEKIELATLTLTGYGSGTLVVTEAEGWVGSEINSLVLELPLTLGEETPYEYEETKYTLSVGVQFNNLVNIREAEYTSMVLEVNASNGTDLVIPLGTDGADLATGTIGGEDVSAIEEAVVIDSAEDVEYTLYTVDIKLPQDVNYTVTVTGEGYRRAYKSAIMTEDKTMYFWNNVYNEGEILPDDEEATEENKKNFLAGDIMMDGEVDIYDLNAVVSYFGMIDMDADYETYKEYIRYDLNRDGKIDARDVAFVLVSWMQ